MGALARRYNKFTSTTSSLSAMNDKSAFPNEIDLEIDRAVAKAIHETNDREIDWANRS